MKFPAFVSAFFCLIPLFSANAVPAACENKGPNVILFTWDGVRSQEFYRGTGVFHRNQLPPSERGQIFKTFWSTHVNEGMLLGAWPTYKISSDIAVSLPSYQALMAGHTTHCKGNDCEPIKETTLLESVRTQLNLPKKDVAVFASWDKIIRAVAKDTSQITHGVYPEIFVDDSSDPLMASIQEAAMKDLPPWGGSRKDQYTFDLGMLYLKKYCPRVLYISLVDSDEFGHQRNYPGYVNSLKTYDQYLDQLIRTLDGMGEYGKQTTLMVTTDHSRGPLKWWANHHVLQNSEKHVFFYARGRGVKPVGKSLSIGNHSRIKPTVEYLMGLKPSGIILPHIWVR